MMTRRTVVKLLGASTLATGLGISTRARAAEVLKIGMVHPKSSPWGQAVDVWVKTVMEKSEGQLELQVFANGQQGDEAAMVAKMKAGQLDGALLSSVGLAKIHAPFAALELPGLATTWAKRDAAREAMKGVFEKGAADAGFLLAGWGDVGLARLATKGFAVRSPDDLKGKKPWLWREDVVTPAVFAAIGGITAVPLGTPEVLPNLNTGAVNAVSAAPLLMEQMQWAGKLDTIHDDVTTAVALGITFSQKRLAALPVKLRAVLTDTAAVTAAALLKRIRAEDAAAFTRLKAKMTLVTRTADERAKWEAVWKQARQKLAQGTFPPDLVAKLETLAT